jgi:indolepyruvate ferredoxin oxidoreductase beta subunit
LWMAFDDIIRVADLKSRESRLQRVHSEVKTQDGDVLQVYEHFKPGVPEVAALLPTGLARRLQQWDTKRVARGLAPWSLPLKIGTHTVSGMLALRTLAAFKHLRPFGSRFATEQQLIDTWLSSVLQGLKEDWQLGFELAQCGRLIKGYGSTNERGKENLLHITQHLATQAAPAGQRAQAVAAARQAALQDEAGTALDAALRAHGAPARPIKPQPIRWFKHRPQ